MKKILILTVTAGNGHNSAANAMKDILEQSSKDVQVVVVDIIKEFTSHLNSWIVDKGYNLAVGHLLPIYNMFCYMKYPVQKASVCPPQASVRTLNEKLLKLIYDFQPDVIYTTTYYGGMALANLRLSYVLPSVNIACMLDYVVSPFWEASIGGVDFLTLAHEDNRRILLEKGFKNENLITTGIPVNEKFLRVIDKNLAREKLGLDPNLFTIFIFYGGGHWHGGYSVLNALIKRIKMPLQIVIVNGHDNKTKEKIDREMKKYPKNFKIKNFGFSKDIDIIMSACDIMIGKGGGLSTTEAINKGLPLIATTHLPSQEVYNIKFLQNKVLAFSFSNFKKKKKIIKHLLQTPHEIDKMSIGMKKLQTDAIKKIANLILAQPKADYSGIEINVEESNINKTVNRARKKMWKEVKKKRNLKNDLKNAKI